MTVEHNSVVRTAKEEGRLVPEPRVLPGAPAPPRPFPVSREAPEAEPGLGGGAPGRRGGPACAAPALADSGSYAGALGR